MSTRARNDTLAWEAVEVGTALPELRLAITATEIVAGAIATRDFMPVHHDRAYANAQGAPDVFMNILSDTGYCGRFLTDWAGPEAMVKRLAIRLGLPVFPGSTLVYTGTVTGKARAGAAGLIDVGFRAATELGDHLSGTATLDLPLREPLG